MRMECESFQVMRRLIVVALVIICFSLHASSDEQISYPGKYIAEIYFKKHDSFIDSLFNAFMKNDIPLKLSKLLQEKSFVVPTASILRRDVVGEGSHRHLSSSVQLKIQPDLRAELNGHSCEVVIIEKLPSGVFSDPFELQNLVQHGEFNAAAVFGDTNLELPSFRSNQSVVEVHMTVGSPTNGDDWQVNLELPIHARYPRLGLGYSRVEFGEPDLLLCCNTEKGPGTSCLFMASEDSNSHGDAVPVWEMPCGIKEHAEIVSVLTFGFAIVAALLIILVSLSYSDGDVSNK